MQGRAPPSVNMHWRRFALNDIPLDTPEEFDVWLRERWYEKDAFMEQYLTTGRLPADRLATKGATPDGYIETEVKLTHWWEVGNIFIVLAAFGLVANLLLRAWNVALYGKQS